MHVLQLLPELRVGGVERGVLDLTQGMLARGHRVSVVSAGGPLVERLVALGAAHHQLPVHSKSLMTMGSCVSAVTQLIETTRVDLVHARSRIPAWIGWCAARRAQRPFLTTAHGFYSPHPASYVMVWGRLVIAPSVALGNYLVERFRLPRSRLRMIARGVALDEFQFQPASTLPQGSWRIGLFGRLSRVKGQEIALHAVEQLRRQGRQVTLCIAGDVPEASARKTLESRIAALHLEDAVEWLGVRHDMPALIASVDVVIVPSVYPESFGRSVIEAQAVGRPVIASAIGALPEMITEGHTGLLVRPGDPQALAEAIGRLMDDAPLRTRCVVHGRKQVEAQFTVDSMVEQTLTVYEELLHRPRILIWKLSALGDAILATPSFRALRRQYPQAHLALAIGRRAYEAVAHCPYLNDFLIYDPAGKDHGLRQHLAFVERLRRETFDLSIDLQNSRSTHLLAWLAGIPVRVGYRRKYGWLLNRSVRLPRVILAPIAHQQYLLRKAGFVPDGESLELWPSPLDEQAARQLLPAATPEDPRPLVGLHPGGSGRWKTKRWDLERWAQLCDALAARQIRVMITGGPEERAIGDAIRQRATSTPHIVIGQTHIMELACLIKRCDVFVAHDSSPLHLAAAVGTPTIALFGPTDPARHLPPAFVGQVIKKDVFCSPCYSPRCRTITHACMKRIGVDEVLSAVLGLLADAEITNDQIPNTG